MKQDIKVREVVVFWMAYFSGMQMVYFYFFFRMNTKENNEASEFHTYILCCSLFPKSITGNSCKSVGPSEFLLHLI